jgi:flagella basal body P-ring formation protein FlgA
MKTVFWTVVATVGLCTGGPFASDELTLRLQRLAATRLNCDTAQVCVILSDLPRLEAHPAAYTFRFASEPRGRTVVRAVAPDHRDVSFSVDVELWLEVAVARSEIARGTHLDTSLVEFMTREISHLTPVSPNEVAHLRARRHISPGTVLTSACTERIPLIQRGSRVTLQAHRGGVRITRSGTALTDAHRGETVRVRVDRRTVIPATAADTNLCRMSL